LLPGAQLQTKAKTDYYSARRGFRVLEAEEPSGSTHVELLAFRYQPTCTEMSPVPHTTAHLFWGDYRGPTKQNLIPSNYTEQAIWKINTLIQCVQ
jgi:hypothetical protein